MSLDEFKDSLAASLFGLTKQDAMAAGICIDCKEPAMPNCYSQAGFKEYTITGMCEKCFDKIFAEE